MEPGITVTRTLPIDAALLGDVLRRLRRDAPGGVLRWGLGGRGTVELDATFASCGETWATSGRIWDAHARLAVVTLSLAARDDDVALVLRAPAPCDVAQAAIDELAEELLWHATKVGVAS
jgi:hypothetical protein